MQDEGDGTQVKALLTSHWFAKPRPETRVIGDVSPVYDYSYLAVHWRASAVGFCVVNTLYNPVAR